MVLTNIKQWNSEIMDAMQALSLRKEKPFTVSSNGDLSIARRDKRINHFRGDTMLYVHQDNFMSGILTVGGYSGLVSKNNRTHGNPFLAMLFQNFESPQTINYLTDQRSEVAAIFRHANYDGFIVYTGNNYLFRVFTYVDDNDDFLLSTEPFIFNFLNIEKELLPDNQFWQVTAQDTILLNEQIQK